MTHGGPRQGAGRKRGTVSKTTAERRQATRELVEAAKAEGETPLEYMLRVMRTSDDTKRRDAMAVAAAPFMHPKLQAVEHSGDKENPVRIVTDILGTLDGATRGLASGAGVEDQDDARGPALAS